MAFSSILPIYGVYALYATRAVFCNDAILVTRTHAINNAKWYHRNFLGSITDTNQNQSYCCEAHCSNVSGVFLCYSHTGEYRVLPNRRQEIYRKYYQASYSVSFYCLGLDVCKKTKIELKSKTYQLYLC